MNTQGTPYYGQYVQSQVQQQQYVQPQQPQQYAQPQVQPQQQYVQPQQYVQSQQPQPEAVVLLNSKDPPLDLRNVLSDIMFLDIKDLDEILKEDNEYNVVQESKQMITYLALLEKHITINNIGIYVSVQFRDFSKEFDFYFDFEDKDGNTLLPFTKNNPLCSCYAFKTDLHQMFPILKECVNAKAGIFNNQLRDRLGDKIKSETYRKNNQNIIVKSSGINQEFKTHIFNYTDGALFIRAKEVNNIKDKLEKHINKQKGTKNMASLIKSAEIVNKELDKMNQSVKLLLGSN